MLVLEMALGFHVSQGLGYQIGRESMGDVPEVPDVP